MDKKGKKGDTNGSKVKLNNKKKYSEGLEN